MESAPSFGRTLAHSLGYRRIFEFLLKIVIFKIAHSLDFLPLYEAGPASSMGLSLSHVFLGGFVVAVIDISSFDDSSIIVI